MTAKIGRGARALLVLGRYDGPDLHWLTAESEALVTRRGRLVRTACLERNLHDTQGLQDDPIATSGFEFEGSHQRSVDLDPGGPYGVPIESTFDVAGRETITVLGTRHDTLAVVERNRARVVRWNFENRYWLDFQTGFAWKSVQHFVPGVNPIDIEITKPAAAQA